MLAVIDYGAGNLFSVKNALDYIGCESLLTASADDLRRADGLILPGVGAFPDAMRCLRESGLEPVVKELAAEKPLFGICLGMQMLFETGEEFGECAGLGLIPGRVKLMQPAGLKIPHMGWNGLHIRHPGALTADLAEGDAVYFVHSFAVETPEEYVACDTDYGQQVTALVHRDNVWGAQFHPEKSGQVGLQMLRNFARLCE